MRRRQRGEADPVDDFLFDYYAYRPSQLRHWHPGAGVVLQGARAQTLLARRGYRATAGACNAGRPTAQGRAAQEQGGCLHANMDLYRHAFRLSPLIGSDLVADAFERARDIRPLDMAASPYDLTALGVTPVEVETDAGRAEYAADQRRFAVRAGSLRQTLLAQVEDVAALLGSGCGD